MTSIVTALIHKDLFLMRWIIVASIAIGSVMVAIMPFGTYAFYGAGTFFIVVVIILNTTMVQSAVVSERKDKSYHFILSFPVNYRQYLQAKIIANMLGYFFAWSVLSLAFVVMVLATKFPDGFIPFGVTLLVYSVAYYFCYLAVCLLTDNVIWSTSVVIIGNVSYSFIIPIFFRFKSITDSIATDNIVWAPIMQWIMGVGMLVGIVSLLSVYLFQSRKRDLI